MSAFSQAQTEAAEIADQIKVLTENEDGSPKELDEAGEDALRSLTENLENTNGRMERLRDVHRALAASNEIIAGTPGSDELTVARPQRHMAVDRVRSFGEFASLAAKGDLPSEEIESIFDATQPIPGDDRSRALADQTTANLSGILPPAWLRDIMEFIGTAMPFVTAMSQAPLPDSGLTITYPQVTTKPSVAVQATQKTDVSSTATVIGSQTANVSTYGGGEDIAVQVLERTDPAYLGIMLELYAEQMATVVDTAAITAATTAITGAGEITLSKAAPENINALLAQGAKHILAARLGLPNVLVLGLDAYEFFAGAADSDGRPLFPDMAPQNALGQSSIAATSGQARGLSWVVDMNMPPTKAIMANSRGFTSFLGAVRTLTADIPAKLGRDYAVYRYAAFAARRPDAMVEFTVGA